VSHEKAEERETLMVRDLSNQRDWKDGPCIKKKASQVVVGNNSKQILEGRMGELIWGLGRRERGIDYFVLYVDKRNEG
jgi:hypothetical protein